MTAPLMTGTTGVVLPSEVSNEIWAQAVEDSAVMRLAQRVDISGAGMTVPMISGTPLEGEWVDEGEPKAIKTPTLGNKQLRAYTIALIVPFSKQFRNNLDALYGGLVQRLPGAITRGFDRTVFGHKDAPGPDFDTLAGSPEVELGGTTAYADLLGAAGGVATAMGDINAWILGVPGELAVLGATYADGRPVFTPGGEGGGIGSIGGLLGRPVVRSRHVAEDNVIGIGGDWTSARYGVVEDITVEISTEATLTGIGNLFERNLFAVRVEATYAFGVEDDNKFVKLVTPAGP